MEKLSIKSTKSNFIACLIILLLIIQVIFDVASLNYEHKTRNTSGDLITENLISSAVDSLLKPASVDPTTGNSYIPEANLVLPVAGDPLLQVEYTYYSQSSVQPKEVDVTSSQNISYAKSKLLDTLSSGTPNNLFNNVPDLQACSTAFSIYFAPINQSKMDEKHTLLTKKTLQDSRTVYIYKDDECSSPSMGELQNLVEKVQSY